MPRRTNHERVAGKRSRKQEMAEPRGEEAGQDCGKGRNLPRGVPPLAVDVTPPAALKPVREDLNWETDSKEDDGIYHVARHRLCFIAFRSRLSSSWYLLWRSELVLVESIRAGLIVAGPMPAGNSTSSDASLR